MKRTPLRKVSPRNKTRVGKMGIVRLRGPELLALKHACHERDGYHCVECEIPVACYCVANHYGHRIVDEDSWSGLIFDSAEMAHIRTKRNNGDVLENVRTLCTDCHRKEHSGELHSKPVPKKERA